MNRRFFQVAMWLPWLALPLTAARFWEVWDRLPLRMATHFAADGHPNGWMTREVALEFALGIMCFMLIVFSIALYVAYRKRVDVATWALLGFLYFIASLIYHGNNSVLAYNLDGQPIYMNWIAILAPVAVVVLIGLIIASGRGKSLPSQAWMAEETHSSPLYSLIFLAPLAIEVAVMLMVPIPAVRFAMAMMSLLFLAIAAHAWDGFHYRFNSSGVEVSTLGFRLRSIPASEIREFSVEPWSLWRGRGIRGVGGTRAYVWGNKVVHIRTAGGDVYLGHAEPERVIRDLQMITTHRGDQEAHGEFRSHSV
jgi:hypothetical protein